MTASTITTPSIGEPVQHCITSVESPSSSAHKHLGLDSLARFLHAFNTHYEERTSNSDIVHPHFDLVENKTVYAIYGELAGLSREEVSVQVNDHLFTITILGQLKRQTPPGTLGVDEDLAIDSVGVVHGDTERPDDAAQPEKVEEDVKQSQDPNLHWHVTERRVGQFRRAFQFPVETVDPSGVTASMHNGLLCVLVPKKTGEKTVGEIRKVEVS